MILEREREALMRLTMCARGECPMCKYEEQCDNWDFRMELATKNMNILADALRTADRKTENSSEKPNNCEHITEDGVTCAKYPACDGCLENPSNKVKGSKRLLKGKDEPQTEDWQDWKDRMWAEAIMTEPQTETEIAKTIVHKMIDDAVIAEDAYPDLRQKMHDVVDEYEPQTDCQWK